MKTLAITILIMLTITNISSAQTNSEFWAEEFLAEVFYGNMTEKSPKTYIEKSTWFPPSVPSAKTFLEAFDIFDTAIINSFNEYLNEKYSNADFLNYENTEFFEWNENAPIFQSPKYKNLIFVDNISDLPPKERKYAEDRYIGKPIFTKDGKYALIEVASYTDHKIKTRLRWNWKKAWKISRTTQYERNISGAKYLYMRNINGKWVKIGSYLTRIS